MSGDVQPRKRKDKKRKKEDSTEQIPIQHTPPLISSQNDDLNIHVHKEGGTGGGICAKIVFFILFSILAILIGFIINENRGLNDLELAEQESRYSQLFEGWTDTTHHDHEEHLANSPEDHESAEIEEAEASEEAPSSVEEASEEHAEEEEEPVEEQESEEPSEEQDLEEAEEVSEEPVSVDEEPEEQESEEPENIDSEETENLESVEELDVESTEEPEVVSAEEEPEDQISAEEEKPVSLEEEVEQTSVEQEEVQEPEQLVEEPPENEIEDGEEVVLGDAEEQQNSKMVVKIGVGVALLVVAHVVLVRKWKSETIVEEKREPTPDLSRRNTIVVPPTYDEIENDIEDVEEEYPEEESKYQELRTTYTRSLTPESGDEYEEEEIEEEEEEVEEEEEEQDEEEEESDDDDLLKRLEARYGKLEQPKRDEEEDDFSSWKRVNIEDQESESDVEYDYESITNKDDLKTLDEAEKNIPDQPAYAIKLFDVLLHKYPSSTRSLYGKAQALDAYADRKRSNEMLTTAIEIYMEILITKNVSNVLFVKAAERCINRMRFLGNYFSAIDVHKKLIARFPNIAKYQNQLVITYLTINRINEARSLLEKILTHHPNDGLALVHYGFILKTVDQKLNESVAYLKKGIESKQSGVVDGRFYFHLGDALTRLGRPEDAMTVYQDGVREKIFLSKYQRSLYNVARLKGQPWWDKIQFDFVKKLESNWEMIRDEGLAVLNENGLFRPEAENLRDTGDWKQFELYARGVKNEKNCDRCPVTCKIIESISVAKGCKRGQTKFSVMHPGTHVWPHCGPTNCRLRVHLGLKVPPKTYIRVADEIRSWKNGEVLVFDDSFEHEVWHNGTSLRLVLIVDVWHPDLTANERRNLSPI